MVSFLQKLEEEKFVSAYIRSKADSFNLIEQASNKTEGCMTQDSIGWSVFGLKRPAPLKLQMYFTWGQQHT